MRGNQKDAAFEHVLQNNYLFILHYSLFTHSPSPGRIPAKNRFTHCHIPRPAAIHWIRINSGA